MRYAAECFATIAGKRAKKLARRAGRLQTLLGDHRDAVAAAAQTESAPPGARLAARLEEDGARIPCGLI